jgi:hypothetical protein
MIKKIYYWCFKIRDLLKQIKVSFYHTLKKGKTRQFSFLLSIKRDDIQWKPYHICRIYIYILCFCIYIFYDSGVGKRNMYI